MYPPGLPQWSHNGLVLAKKIGFDFEDLEKSINPESPETGIHNEEGLLPRFVLSEILPAILSSSEDNNSSEDEDLRDCFTKEENSQPIFRRRVWSRLFFCKDEKSFIVKIKKEMLTCKF